MTGKMPDALVLGLSPTGLHVVRELGRAGVRAVGVAEGMQAGRLSRYLARCIQEPDPAVRLELLCDIYPASAAPADRPVLLPTSDQEIEFVISNAERLAKHFAFAPSYRDGLAARIMTKESFYAMCEEHGVPYPRFWKGTRDEIATMRDRITYPCMVKPSRIHDVKQRMRGRKGWTARSAAEFDAVLPAIPDGAGVLLVQEIVPGPESEITLYCAYLDARGEVHQPFTGRKLRQYPPGFGSASLAQSAPEEETRHIAETFLRRIGYSGVAAAEFKRNPSNGELRIIEVNVRPSLWFSLTAAAGKHPVLAAYRDLAGCDIGPPEQQQRDGVRWRYALKDAWSASFYRRHPDFVLPAPDLAVLGPASGQVGAVYAADDPAPVAADALGAVGKLASRLGRRSHGS